MNRSTVAQLGILAATAALAAGCSSDDTDQTAPTTGSSDSAATGAATPDSFTAGTYDVEAQYNNPDGVTSIAVSLTIDDAGTVSAVTVTPEAAGGNGLMFQKIFAENIGAEVVGKKITEINVDKVAGSSLTSDGFNSAVATVIAQAGQ